MFSNTLQYTDKPAPARPGLDTKWRLHGKTRIGFSLFTSEQKLEKHTDHL